MKYKATRFKSLEVCLKELEPFIRDGAHLQTGKPFVRFDGLRSRELLANWLLCVAVNSTTQPNRLNFTSDPTGGDGIIIDITTGETWQTEHVLVPGGQFAHDGSIDAQILEAVESKQNKGGRAYASGKTLVVFLNSGGGEWFPTKVARQLPKVDFEAVWVVGLQSANTGEYLYSVTRLDLSRGQAPAWLVRIANDFTSWIVEPVQ